MPTITPSPALAERIQLFVKHAGEMVAKEGKSNFPNLPPDTLELSWGPRYAKVISTPGMGAGRSVWAFVDLANGDILKPAGWNKPAKHARGSVMADDFGVSSCTQYGPRYLR